MSGLAKKFDVVIAGGGLAGLAAAVTLADAGARVCLIEAKRRLGGRATSFVDSATGEVLDNCQHVALGCCRAYLGLCERLKVMDCFDWYREQYWVEAGGRVSVIAPSSLPAPLHYAGSFVRAQHLSWEEKGAIARGMINIRLSEREMYKEWTFGAYLAMAEQPKGAIAKFWEPVIVSACNLSVDRVCASSALKVFQDGFLSDVQAGVMGVPKVPLVRLYDAVERVVCESGGEVRLGESVVGIEENGRGVVASRGRSEMRVEGERVICALPVARACALLERDERLAGLRKILARDGGGKGLAAGEADEDVRGSSFYSSILGVHVEFDQHVTTLPHAVLVERGTQWIFRKDADGRRFHAVISGADAWMGLTEEEIINRVADDVRACFVGARHAKVVWGRAVKERQATFAATPEFEAARANVTATARGSFGRERRGIVLAGDYTNTQWPATMEGATLSGLAAAGICGRSAR